MRLSRDGVQKLRGLTIVVLPLVGFLIAVILFWERYVLASDLWLLLAMYSITLLGIGIGYHRMLTHQGFDAPRWLRGLILIFGSMAWEGAPICWTATHIKHHAHSDEEEDPHTPLHGFWHAHVGWIFHPRNFPDARQYAPHLLADPVVVFVDRFAWLWMTLALVIPLAIGGWTGFLWGGVVRIFLTTHVTWSVNSICHLFGKRAFETTDESRNEWVIGLLAFGEGWHNNHHAFPRSAFHGHGAWQFDLSGVIIRLLEKIGLVWNVQRVSEETMDAHRRRTEGMVASLQVLRSQVLQSIAGATDELEGLFSRSIHSSISSEEYVQLQSLHAQAVARLQAIRAAIARAGHLKRPRLIRYLSEAQEVLQSARVQVQQQAGTLVSP